MSTPNKGVRWIVLGVSLQIGLALTKFIPGAAGLWHTDDAPKFYSALATFVGIQLILTSATLLLFLRSQMGEVTQKIESALSDREIRSMKDYEFYQHFLTAAEQAEYSVRIAYFAPYPPTDVNYKNRRKYYESMLQLMQQRPKVNFRRIVRKSPKNSRWIAELIRQLEGRPNVEIAVLTRDLPSNTELPLALSVQLVDRDKAWIVAAGSHETQEQFRDVFVRDVDVATSLGKYYDRLWDISEKVLDHGRPTESAQKFLGGEDDSY